MNRIEQEYYGKYAEGLEELEAAILEQLLRITKDMEKKTGENAIEHIRSRIKGAKSLSQKLQKKGKDLDFLSAVDAVSDIIGFRIVTHFVGEVYEVSREIQNSGKWRVEKVKDYISNPKGNGYRSFHIIIAVSPADLGVDLLGIPEIRMEIQIRTVAMDCWASLEHEMKYKREIQNADLIIGELKRCADEMASTDLSMQTIKEMINNEEE